MLKTYEISIFNLIFFIIIFLSHIYIYIYIVLGSSWLYVIWSGLHGLDSKN